MLIAIFLMIIISTSLTVPTQPSPRFHVEAWLPFRNREMDYSIHLKRGRNISCHDLHNCALINSELVTRHDDVIEWHF